MSIDLCIALLISVPIFWLLPVRWRYGFLALASVAYLLWVDGPKTQAALSVVALACYGTLFWALTPWIAARNRWVEIAVFALAPGFLLYFKYLPPILNAFVDERTAHFVLPLGISYYTFKLLHYLFEVARGTITDRSLSKFFCYLYLFPTFTAGPIERYDHFLANLETRWSGDATVEGMRRVIFGLIKRFVLARILNGYINGRGITELNVLERLGDVSPHWLWGYFILYYLYVYLDFSAYSDIAIGASRLFGIRPIAEELAARMIEHGESFWTVVYPLFMSRDLTREDMRRIVRIGLEKTSGNYRLLTRQFGMTDDDYKRFLGFLRKHECHLPFQRFRVARVPGASTDKTNTEIA
jgi:alginate O-acetyltransferase complex protein AlgI